MEKTRKTDWLMAQGFRLSRLPSKLTWFTIDKVSGQEREFITQVNNYNLNLYRGKGCVLDRKYLNPEAWHELEYGGKPPVMGTQKPKPPATVPRLATAVKEALGKAYFWQGAPTELLALIDAGKQGIPKEATGLSMQIMKPHITDALNTYGITVQRKRTASERLLQVTSITSKNE